jgi:predicted small lipoprotein YifL
VSLEIPALGARVALVGVLLAAFSSVAACGQQGPLTLPGAEPAQSSSASGPTEPSPSPAEGASEDEAENER